MNWSTASGSGWAAAYLHVHRRDVANNILLVVDDCKG